ncbi:MAG TPA: ABC transporter permease [Pyrinomonadaceae bacterium]|nr:ABC transporter permease [Pyrinomonadaceae bacterium]
MQTLRQDVRYAAKMLWKSKGVTVLAVISLAIGIGANSAIFSIVNSLLLRPRPVANPEQIVELYSGDTEQPYHTLSYPSYLDFRENNHVFTGLAAYGIRQYKLGGPNQVEQIWGEAVSGNYFDVIGVPAFLGRTFAAEEDQVLRRNPVVVISHDLWQRRFNSDPSLVGQTISLNNQQLTVIGVAPAKYTGMIRGMSCQVWVPAMMMPAVEENSGDGLITSRGSKWLILVGRLKPDTTIAQARARFELLTKDMQAAQPNEWIRRKGNSVREQFVSVLAESETRVHPQMRESAYAAAALLFVIVNLVMLIACMNLASMLLARAVVRRNEIAVRLALGASRKRIIRQLLTESVLLSTIAGAAGILLAIWLLNLLIGFMPSLPEGIRLAFDLHLDWRVLVYTIAVSMITGVLFGLAPALQSSKADVSSVLKDDSTVSTGRYRKSRLRMSLVVAQVAFSLLLLISAGLVLRSLEKLRPTRLGFSSDNIVLAPVRLDERDYDRRKGQEFYRSLSERVAALPGVQNVSLAESIQGGFTGGSRRSIEIEGYKPSFGESLHLDSMYAGPGYFTNMKVPFVQGRDFDERDQDGATCVSIVNEVFAQRYFGGTGQSPGKHLIRGSVKTNDIQMCEVVGVIRDNNWHALENDVRPFFALAVMQSNFPRMFLMVNTSSDPQSLVSSVRRTIQELDPKMPVADVQTINENFAAVLYPFRLLAIVMAGCGVMALLLATIGIYGVVAYSVAQRTREVGIRMALGALRGDILKLVVGQGMLLVIYGLALGLLLGFALTRVLASSIFFDSELLFGITATDSLTFGGVTILLALVALAACYLPARRATNVNPVEALRNS